MNPANFRALAVDEPRDARRSHDNRGCSSACGYRHPVAGNPNAALIPGWRLFESAAELIFRYELQPLPQFTYVNQASASMTGYSPEEFYADPDLLLKIAHPDDRHVVETVLRGGFSSTGAAAFRCIPRTGSAIWIKLQHTRVPDANGVFNAVECIGSDVTELRLLEEQLRQSQKMEAIGLLTGGVAHDFNNLLTVILGYSDLMLLEDFPAVGTVRKIAQVKRAAEQAAGLTRQLLAFGRRQTVRLEALNLNEVVESNAIMLRRIIGEDVELVIALDPGLESAKADTSQIEQILMNLAVNARAAMPQGGRITIATQNVTLNETRGAESLDGSPGPHVMLTVSDTGCGMDASTLNRIFEPFYTTKKRGTGLGLSIVHGIVKQGRGHIRVKSDPGKGTRFEILLPAIENPLRIPAFLALPSGAEPYLSQPEL